MSNRLEDKRVYPRVGKRVNFRYQISGTAVFDHSVTRDISVGGLGFVHHDFIEPYTDLQLELNILSRIMNSTARVKWVTNIPHSDRYRLGLEFVDFNPADKKYLHDYISMFIP